MKQILCWVIAYVKTILRKMYLGRPVAWSLYTAGHSSHIITKMFFQEASLIIFLYILKRCMWLQAAGCLDQISRYAHLLLCASTKSLHDMKCHFTHPSINYYFILQNDTLRKTKHMTLKFNSPLSVTFLFRGGSKKKYISAWFHWHSLSGYKHIQINFGSERNIFL